MQITPSIVTLWDEQGLPAPCERVQRHARALRDATMQVAAGFYTPREILAWTIRRVEEANRGEPPLPLSSITTLRYFRRRYARDPQEFWIADDNTPPARLFALLNAGLIERCLLVASSDLYRITPKGIEALGGGEPG